MLAADRDALICDLAETYHVLDMTALPVPLLATLAAGLRGDSRIRLAMSGERVTNAEMLQAAMLDRLTTLCWMQSRDGAHGRRRPPSVLDAISGKEEQSDSKPVAYNTPADFERARARIIKRGDKYGIRCGNRVCADRPIGSRHQRRD